MPDEPDDKPPPSADPHIPIVANLAGRMSARSAGRGALSATAHLAESSAGALAGSAVTVSPEDLLPPKTTVIIGVGPPLGTRPTETPVAGVPAAKPKRTRRPATSRVADVPAEDARRPVVLRDTSGTVITNAEGGPITVGISDTAKTTDRFDATLIRFSLPVAWEADRQEAMRLLRDLPAALLRLGQLGQLVEELHRRVVASDRAGIGHNQPRDDYGFAVPVQEVVADATLASDALFAEIFEDRPHLSSIHLAARALMRVVRWIEAAGEWVGKRVTVFTDQYLKALATPAALSTAAVILDHLTDIREKVAAVIVPMTRLFALLHVTF